MIVNIVCYMFVGFPDWEGYANECDYEGQINIHPDDWDREKGIPYEPVKCPQCGQKLDDPSHYGVPE